MLGKHNLRGKQVTQNTESAFYKTGKLFFQWDIKFSSNSWVYLCETWGNIAKYVS